MNQKTWLVRERLEQLNLDPIAALAAIATDASVDVAIRARVLSDLAGFAYPKQRAIEVSNVPSPPVAPMLIVSFLEDELRARDRT